MKAFRIFTNHRRAERFAKKHNGVIITELLGTGRFHYEVWYEKEGEVNGKL